MPKATKKPGNARLVPTASLKGHPLAHLVPDMRHGEWQDFYNDIAFRGIVTPLEILADGTVVDGRHRLKAAKQLSLPKVPVVDAPLNGEKPEVYMLKAAVLRRHLTDDQRSAIARLWIKENKQKRDTEGKFQPLPPHSANGKAPNTHDKAQDLFKVGPKKLDHVTYVEKHNPELFEKVHQGEITLSNAYQKIKNIERNQNNQNVQVSHPSGGNIISGPCSDLEEKLPDNYVDLFFTDPPYAKESLHNYTQLAKLAQAKLRQGGLCLSYCPHPHLDQVIRLMTEYLDYWWVFAVFQTGGQARIWGRRLWASWKPILAFTKRPSEQRATDTWFCDSFRGAGEDKRYHEWGQDIHEATYFIEALCPPAGLVVDPFCGGGTILLAARLTSRNWLGTEIDPGYAATARKRLEGTYAVP